MEKILYALVEHKLLASIAGFILIAIETFVPTLPLVVIIVANSYVLGMWLGFIVSWLGSSISATFLYLLSMKLAKNKYAIIYKQKEKVKNIVNWIKNQGFTTIFLCYLCPFIPDFIVTIASGFIQVDFKTYIIGMSSGKFVMFLLLSYMGEDFENIYKQPEKIIILVLTIFIFWVLSKKINNKINNK